MPPASLPRCAATTSPSLNQYTTGAHNKLSLLRGSPIRLCKYLAGILSDKYSLSYTVHDNARDQNALHEFSLHTNVEI